MLSKPIRKSVMERNFACCVRQSICQKDKGWRMCREECLPKKAFLSKNLGCVRTKVWLSCHVHRLKCDTVDACCQHPPFPVWKLGMVVGWPFQRYYFESGTRILARLTFCILWAPGARSNMRHVLHACRIVVFDPAEPFCRDVSHSKPIPCLARVPDRASKRPNKLATRNHKRTSAKRCYSLSGIPLTRCVIGCQPTVGVVATCASGRLCPLKISSTLPSFVV
eukprot:scaffold1378_cov160-Amphora_coffeaeformis.AAC.5